MATKKKLDRGSEIKPKPLKVKKTESIEVKNGVFEGEYSKSLYNNGELVSFDIDWDKLKEYMKKI
ncbi:hypothetical protein EB118_22710 [bacterium]|nr:hypothetical protein [bacterium]